MTVYVVQEPLKKTPDGGVQRLFDLTPALKYGELKFLLEPFNNPMSPAPVIGQLRRGLRDFNDEDYLLAIGNPTLIGWATGIAADINNGKVSMLQWDGRARQYLVTDARLWGKNKEEFNG